MKQIADLPRKWSWYCPCSCLKRRRGRSPKDIARLRLAWPSVFPTSEDIGSSRCFFGGMGARPGGIDAWIGPR